MEKYTFSYKCTKETVSKLFFPYNEEEKERWASAFTNKITVVIKYMGVCEKHWRDGYKKTRK